MFSRRVSCLAIGVIFHAVLLTASPVEGITGRTVDYHHIEADGPDNEAVLAEPADMSRYYLIKSVTAGVKRDNGTPPVRAVNNHNIRPGILDGVAVKESADRGVVSFSTNGIVEYEVYASTKSHRKWINIVFPRITSELPDHLDGGDRIIGQIYLEKNKDGKSLKISVEILPLKTGYEVFHQDGSLILKVTRQ
jgi:hypothetical protein